jgi:hypothetical protein
MAWWTVDDDGLLDYIVGIEFLCGNLILQANTGKAKQKKTDMLLLS